MLAWAGAPADARLPDMDRDGRADLLLRNGAHGSWLYYSFDDGGAALHRVRGATRNLAYRTAGTGDFDGDGASEMLLRHRRTGAWIHYAVQNRRAKLRRMTTMAATLAQRPVGVGDFDGDGADDLLLRDGTDGHWVVHDGLPAAPRMRPIPELPADFSLRLAGIGDFDGDGTEDMLLRHAGDGSWLAHAFRSAHIAARPIAELPTDLDQRPAGAGDFDGDGTDEVLLRHAREGTWEAYDITGSTASAWSVSGVTKNLDYEPAGVGDLDGDGDDDLLLRHANNGRWIHYALADHSGALRRLTGATTNRDWRPARTAEDRLLQADRSIGEYLAAPLDRGASPGLFAAIFDADGVRAIAAAGLRKQDAIKAVTITDLVHIGSNTKAMTSAMLATLVADGTFRNGWDTTFGEVFPELLRDIHAHYPPITLRRWVTMSSGVAANATDWGAHGDLPLAERRLALLRDNLTAAPAGAAGEFPHSNLAYVAAAAMAERLTGQSWESLMRERVFAPLGMSRAGFGSPGTHGAVDAPWGHRRDTDGRWQPNQQDNPPAIGPAGIVHLTLEDWAAFAGLWLGDGTEMGLDDEALRQLVTPVVQAQPGDDYAAGWVVTERAWGGGTVLAHGGSNTSWHTMLWLAPNVGRAYAAGANSAEVATPLVLDEIIGQLILHEPLTP